MNSEQRKRLIEQALVVRPRAYAPYSQFLVGATVLTETGQIYAGCNVENASFGLTICAERSAVFQAIAAGAHKLLAVAIAASSGVTPCGACRQVLAEFAKDLPVLLVDSNDPNTVLEMCLSDLLPHRFILRNGLNQPGGD